ncbi:tetratricopeptide repeat protein [candidate division WOR-3 bacterium]|nr:tetratricopeptide repeat protein [candidate division WOR-3 bacterium]
MTGRYAERRLVTVFFADLANFTSLCHRIDPEDTVRIANICFEHINNVVEGNGGLIHKYDGDAVMCLFGFPVAYEDVPERAVKAGLQLIEKMSEINESVFKETGLECNLGLHIGIHSGLAVVAEVGSGEKKEYTVMGDTVNLASRLKDTAVTGEILVSEQIYKATQYLFEFREAESCTLKGIVGKMKLYQPLKIRQIPGAKRGIKGLYSPLVGRKTEFKLMKEKIFRLKEGNSGILFVTGDAGIGKSRFWQETKNFIEDEGLGINVLEGQCLYHGEHLSYWPVLQILEQIYAVTDKDNQDIIKAKIVEKTKEILPKTWKDVAPYIGHLFSLEFTGELGEKVKYLDPKDIQIKILGSIKALLQGISEKAPLLLTIEDYHWIDAASLEFIRFMFGGVDFSTSSNLMLLCLARVRKEKACFKIMEELKHEPTADKYTEIRLEPLDNYSSLELTYNLLEIPGFTEDFKEKLLAKAEGNPFFLEEIINSFIDSGALYYEAGMWKIRGKVEDIRIPDTIQLVIAARLDRLEDSLKSVLQMASVIGRTFYESILAQIHEDKKRLIEYLETLEEYEFILQLISSGQSREDIEYMFKHPLIQQVTYTSLLKSKRRKLHKKVAESMELLYKDRIDDFVALIAQQYAASDEYTKAIEWLGKAGKKAKQTYANEDALDYYQKSIAIIEEHKIDNRQALVAAYEAVADIHKTVGDNDRSIQNYEKILEITDDGLTHARIIRKIGDTYQKQSMYPEALEYLGQSKKKMDELCGKIKELEDKDAYFIELHTIYHSLAWVNYLVGDFPKAQSYCEQSLAELSHITDKKKRNLAEASTLNVIAAIESRTGRTEESYQCYQKAEKIYKEEGDLPGLGTVYNNCVNYFAEKGDYISCIEYLEKSLEIACKTGSALSEAITSYNLGHEYLNLGKFELARMYLDRYQKLNKLINNRLGEGWANEAYSDLYAEEGDKEKAMASIDKAIEIFGVVKSKIKETSAKLTKADLLIDTDKYEAAEELLKEVEEYAEKNSISHYLVSIHISRGQLHLKKDELKKALAELHKAEEAVKEAGWTSALTSVYYYLGRVLEKQGDEKEGAKYLKMAKKTLKQTAKKITDEALRESYLNKSFNRKVLSA